MAGIALFAPQGTLIAGSTLMVVGSVMVLAGYGVGAYAAFGEDFLYGFLYLVIPLYTAYYLVTRWEDPGLVRLLDGGRGAGPDRDRAGPLGRGGRLIAGRRTPSLGTAPRPRPAQ